MSSLGKGRYRPLRTRRRRAKGRAIAVLALPITAIVVGNALVDSPPPIGEVTQAIGDDATSAARPDVSSRGSERAEPIGEGDPLEESSVDATLSGPLVNDRVQPFPVEPPQSGDGRYSIVSGTASGAGDGGNVIRYLVEVEDGLPFDAEAFAAEVHQTLNDPRGWGETHDAVFERVDSGDVRFRVSLSSPDLTDQQCYPLRTFGRVSCWNGARSVINALRWGVGAETFGNDLLSYREYLINHEVGHALGHDHVSCAGAGLPAAVMVQQTKSLEGCTANAWPELDP